MNQHVPKQKTQFREEKKREEGNMLPPKKYRSGEQMFKL